jgi:large repetitive protein
MYTSKQRNWPSATANGIPLTDPVVVSFNGDVVVFARAKGTPTDKLYYNVRHNDPSATDSNLEYSGWYEWDMSTVASVEAGAAATPVGLRELGAGLISVPSSAHAPQPADLAFNALSDERYIYIFRPSVNGTLYLDRFVLLQVPAPQEANNQVRRDAGSTKPTRYQLERIWETRFRVSGKKDTPADDTDVVGYRDMLGNPFIEPTLELGVLPRSAGGNFAVTLLPTSEVDQRRWCFFVAATNQVQVLSWPQSSDGLFDFLPATKSTNPVPLSSFSFSTLYEDGQPLTCEAGIAVRVYAEQDSTQDGTKLRRAMRLMATVPVSGVGLDRALAVYDFNILPSGYLPPPIQSLPSPLLDGKMVGGKFTPPDPVPARFPLPASVVHLSANSTIYAYLLGSVQPAATPYVLDGGDGLVHCYYAGVSSGDDNPFLVAQYSPEVQRPYASLVWAAGDQDGLVELVAQRPGTTLNQLKVTVADTTDEVPSADLCDMTVDYDAAVSGIGPEHWTGLPRELGAMTDVLNGNASGELSAQAVQEGSLRYFDYAGMRSQARLPLGDAAKPVGWLTLVSTRLDLTVTEVQVSAGNASDKVTLALRLTQGNKTVQQTWADVPVGADDLRTVLRGDAASFSYTPSVGDPWVLALSAGGGTATILFYASATAVAGQTSIAISAGSETDKVNVKIVSGTFDKSWVDLPADSTMLAKVLLDIPEVADFFPVISANDHSGPVAIQEVSKPVDLRTLSTLFGTLPPGSNALVVEKTVAAVVLQGHRQTAPLTGKTLADRLVALSAIPVQSPTNGIAAVVGNQIVNATPADGNGAWVSAKPLYALNLTGGAAMTVPTDLPNFDELAPSKTFTLETWLSPNLDNLDPKSAGKARVLSFNGTQASQTPTWEVAPSAFVTVFAQPALQFGLLKTAGATPSFGYVEPDDLFAPEQAFTWEIWIKAAAQVSLQGENGSLLQILDPNNPTNTALELSLDGTLTPIVTVNDGNNLSPTKASSKLQPDIWTHLAVTGELTDSQKGQWLVSLYVNGSDTSIKNQQVTIAWSPTGPNALFIGGSGDAVDPTAAAAMAEVRYWQIRRTRSDIQDSLYFTLSGTEPGLAGYWPLDDKLGAKSTDPWPIRNLAVVGGKNLDGEGQPSNSQDVISSADGAFLAMASGIGGAPPLKANAFLRSTHWNHIAVSYRAGSSVRLSAADRHIVNCGNDRSLNVISAFSVESWIQADPSSQPVPQTLVAKWGKDASQQSYWLGLNASGKLNLQAQLQYTNPDNEKVLQKVNEIATGSDLRDGQPHHVAATLATEAKTDKSDPQNVKTYVIITVTFYVDGKQAGSVQNTIPPSLDIKAPFPNVYTAIVQATTTDLTLGAAAQSPPGVAANTAPEAQMYYTGMLTGVVIWSRAVDIKDIANSIEERSNMDRDGAIAAWWFREQAGVDAVDSIAGLVAKLSSNTLWAVYNRLSELLFYANGRQLLGATGLTDSESAMSVGYPSGPSQFTLGGYQNGAALDYSLPAQFDEVRLWQQVRSPRQIADMRFARLVGSETGLAGYWNFDDERLLDRSLFGNNGTMWNKATAPFVPSAAPVSNEGPAVLNIYGGQPTEFQQRLNGTPAVIEFSEVTREPTSALQPDAKDGQPPKLLGSLERAYFYTSGSTVNLTPGFYVGALQLIYLGQVQTDATLIGYIEGAPPVPSENLTRPYYSSAVAYFNYFNASSITLTSTETTTLVFSSSYSSGATLDHTTAGGFAWKTKVDVGLGIESGITDNEFTIGIKEKGGLTTQDVSIQNASSSWSLAMTDSTALRGNWESDDPAKWVNPQVGRRFLPDNVGYALVSSLTADVYLTLNAATRAAVGRAIVPNPDIPPDSNILTFRIDPHYIKNGTLDGKVGLYNDPDYSTAGSVPGSYFKPIEAYRLKRQIAQKAVDEEKYYEQFNAYQRAISSTKSLDDQEPERLVERTSQGSISRKGMANTYVWTAAGGMHTEQEQFTDQFTTTFTGGYSVNNQFGPVISFKGTAGPTMMVGGFFTLDWLAGFKIDITATKARTQANAFGLNVSVIGEPALLGNWDGKNYGDKPIVGKVASYRFLTFYLPPDTSNGSFLMSDILDPVWLQSNEPDAVTLRSANTGNPAWRILHRVTYVNRIPPALDNMPNQTLPAPITRIVDLANNEVLVALILTEIGNNQPTPPIIGAAVASVLNPPGSGASKLNILVPWWDDFLATTRGDQRIKANYELLQGLQLDVLEYVVAGFADGTLPLEGNT